MYTCIFVYMYVCIYIYILCVFCESIFDLHDIELMSTETVSLLSGSERIPGIGSLLCGSLTTSRKNNQSAYSVCPHPPVSRVAAYKPASVAPHWALKEACSPFL